MFKNQCTYLAVFLLFAISLSGQKYFTKTGEISFFSKSPIEDIEATTNSANSVFDRETGQIQWAVLIKSFEFEKALMQEHFNENYMESSTYPKAMFKGQINNVDELDLEKDGRYTTELEGTLEIHGVAKTISTEAIFEVNNNDINATSTFKVLVADYDIKIPNVVKDNIAKEIEVKIDAKYEKLDRS